MPRIPYYEVENATGKHAELLGKLTLGRQPCTDAVAAHLDRPGKVACHTLGQTRRRIFHW